MKKFYLLLAAMAVCATMNAQEYFKVTCNDEVVKDGASCISKEKQEYGTIIQYSSGIHVQALRDCTLNVSVTNTNKDIDIEFCWPMTCQLIKVGKELTTSKEMEADGEPEDLGIHYTSFNAEEIVNVTADISVWADEDAENVLKFGVIFGNDPDASVKSIQLVQGVVLDGSNLRYVGLGESRVVVSDLSGRVFKVANVTGEGTIDLSTLPAGLYVYNVKGNNAYRVKLIVR